MRRRLPLVAALVAVPVLAFVAARVVVDAGEEVVPAMTAPDTTTTTTEAPVVTTEASAPSTPPPTRRPAATTSAPPVTSPTGGPVAASDPDGLARQIVAAEAAIGEPSTPPDELARMGHLQQVAYRKLVAEPGLKDAVLARLPARLRSAAAANVTAGAKLRALLKKPKETLPDWRIVAPAPAEELLGYYREAEARIAIPWQYLAAIHLVETRMGRIRGTSEAGAQGPMQFMPSTWAAYGEGDINSNRDSIAAAARYLQRNGAPGDMRRALYRYNNDYRYVDAVTIYAERMRADERAFWGYYQWQVYYVTMNGDVWLPEGYGS